ncbi:ABC transporter substrate-binding protein [Arachnia propionica]|uniref:ABC transporter substrate-binding protein n=1 Tax=Arachnia propionica TaxID=1750 RepID=A0A3P1TBN0_9ACTN|nr:ABC transporter substrate-binding protein [Arachnia propionica]RRD06710.1 ABC transporter substrate-binding protein [Arachnia propionica]
MKPLRLLAALAVLTALTAGCTPQSPPDPSSSGAPSQVTSSQAIGSDGCVSTYDPAADYFPDKVTFTHAEGVTVEYHGSYKVVTVTEPVMGAAPETYVLVQCGTTPDLPADLADAQQVTIPVKRAVTSSTTQLPAFELLEATDALTGVGSPTLVWSEKIRTRIADGSIAGIGDATGALDVETIAAAEPDVFISSGTPDPVHDKLRELKIPVLGNSEWLESSPLGRAEWVKFTALLTNTEARANEVFTTIETDYEAVRAKVADVAERPSVVTGAPFQGEWYKAGGRSYAARLLADAGMAYIFADDESNGSQPVAIEAMLEAAVDADLWLNADYTGQWADTSAIAATDPRLMELKAAKQGQVYNPVLRINEGGGNDYWEQGVVRPDLVLRDLAKIAHPDLFTDAEFVFYAQLPA